MAALAAPALAADCGTIVIPPGIGIGPGADVTSFNPLFITSTYNGEAANLLFAQLLWINRFHEVDWSRSIASAMISPDGGKTYVMTLRPWSWSDGVPLTSADVVYTFNLIKSYGTFWSGYGIAGLPDIVANIAAPDASHVVITLKHAVNPQWFILNGFYNQFQPLPEHVWSHYTNDQIWQAQSDPAFFQVVDGPLILRKFVVGVDAQFVPNPHYPLGAMHFDRFIMKFENSEGQELQAVQSGDLDMANIPFDLFDQARGLRGFRTVTLPPTYSWHEFIPNMGNKATKFFADVRVRDAMADAINQAQIVQLAMHGQGITVHSAVPPVPDTFLSPQEKAGNFPTQYDPAKAKALLSAAGFVAGPDGVLTKGAERLSFVLEIPAGQPLRIEMAEVMQQDLAAVGIQMTVRQVEFNQMLTQLVSEPQAWEAILIAQDQEPFPTGEGQFATGAFYDNNGYSSAVMDALIKQSTDQPGVDGLFAYEDYSAAQQPVIFLPNEQYAVLVRKGLQGVENFMNPLGLWAPEKLYCEAP
jgi:peptide/nickel transport system substrate-binding protein